MAERPSWPARLFRPFSRVEPGEVRVVSVMTLASFLLLTAYYLLKTVREPLILLGGGAEVKLYALAAQAGVMAVFVHLYGELAQRMGRVKLLTRVFAFFILNLIGFAALVRFTAFPIGLPFFLWVGLFSYTVIAQFWAVAADIYTEEQGKRLFPVIGGGASIGAVAGAALARPLVPLGPATLMAVSVVLLCFTAFLVLTVSRSGSGEAPEARQKAVKREESPLSDEGAFRLLLRDRYLLLIGAMVIFLNWVDSSGEYLLDRILLVASEQAKENGTSPQVFIGAFKADYFALYNLLGVVLQLFAVSRILRLIGVRRALFVMPVFAFTAYGAVLFLPVLGLVRLVMIGENGIQYSLQDTARHALFLNTTSAEKFVGKTAIDTVAVRLGAICAALTAFAAKELSLSIQTLAAVNVGLSAVWIGIVIAIGREHLRRTSDAEPGNSPLPMKPAAPAPTSGSPDPV